MTYRELYRLLEEKIEQLRASREETSKLVAGYTSDMKRLDRLQDDLVADLYEALNNQFGDPSPSSWIAHLESLGLTELENLVESIQATLKNSEKARKQLVDMPDMEALERDLEADRKVMEDYRDKRDLASDTYSRLLEQINLCDWAKRLVKEGQKLGYESWESLQDRSFFQRLRDRRNRGLQLYIKNLENYRSDMARLPGFREMVMGDDYDPRDLVKTEQTLEEKSLKARKAYESAYDSLRKTRDRKKAWERLKYEASDMCQRMSVNREVGRAIRGSEALRLALGNIVKPDIQTKLVGGKEPWSEDRAKALWSKTHAYKEIIKYNQEALKGIDKAIDTLEKPYSKLRRNISRIGSKQVRKMDPEAIEKDLNAAVMAADYRNRWFRSHQRSFATESDPSMNWLFWTSMYLVLSDSDQAFTVSDPALNEAMTHFREQELTQFDLGEAARAGQLDTALSDSGLGDLSGDWTNNLPDMSDLSSRLSGMDSGFSDLSSLSSSFDSGSSFSSSSFDSGGSFGGSDF